MEGQRKISGICDSELNENQEPATESSSQGNIDVAGFTTGLDFDQNIVDDCSELSYMSFSSTLGSEPELFDLSPPSDLEDSTRMLVDQHFDGDMDEYVDVVGLGEPVYYTGILNLPEARPETILEPITDAMMEPMSEQQIEEVFEAIREQMDEMAEPQLPRSPPMQEFSPVPYTDLESLTTDCAAVQQILINSEQRFQEVARIWDMFQNFVHLLANPPTAGTHLPFFMPVQQVFPLNVTPNANLQNILDPQQTLSWTEYQQQVEEFFNVVDLFVELILFEILNRRFF